MKQVATLCAATALVTGCAAEQKGLEVRAIKDAASVVRTGNPDLAQAQAYLALGNPGLALEAYRKINRTNPSAEAHAGIAACYRAIGRLDQAQANYEAALAIAPNSPSLLLALANVFEREGLHAQAIKARVDARLDPHLAAAAVSDAALSAQGDAPLARMDRSATITVALPTARPADLAATRLVGDRIHIAADEPKPAQARAMPAQSIPRPMQMARAAITPNQRWAEGSSVTVTLPPARETLPTQGPRLERLTQGEVALVTTARSLWSAVATAMPARPTPRPATLATQWVPLDRPGERPTILILNAARTQGIAASARASLLARGWRRIDVGDAGAVRAASVVMYPPKHQQLGRRLAAQFGLAALPGADGPLMVYLGRDQLRRAGARQPA